VSGRGSVAVGSSELCKVVCAQMFGRAKPDDGFPCGQVLFYRLDERIHGCP